MGTLPSPKCACVAPEELCAFRDVCVGVLKLKSWIQAPSAGCGLVGRSLESGWLWLGAVAWV